MQVIPKKNWFNKIISFYRTCFELGLTKKNFFISISLYFLGVFFEAIGIFLILPLFSLFLTGKGIDQLINSQQVIIEILKYVEAIGIEPNKKNISITLLVVLFLRQFVIYSRTYWNSIVVAKLMYNLRKDALNYFLLSRENLFDKEATGKKINDLTTEVNVSAMRILSGIELIGILIMFMTYFVLMLMLSWKLTVLATFSFIFSMYILKPLWTKAGETGTLITKNNRKLVSHLTKRFTNLKLLKISGNVTYEKALSENIISEIKHKQIRAGFINSIAYTCIEPIILISGATLLFVSIDVLDIDIANLGLFSLIMIRGVPLARIFFYSWQKIEANLASLIAVKDTIKSLQGSNESDKGTLEFNKFQKIEFKKVNFSYQGIKKRVIKSVSFEIKKGDLIALVGPSGAGKSTIVDFIPRLISPSSGKIELNNIKIENYKLSSLRANIGYLPQNPQILEDTIAGHIRYGNSNLTDKDIKLALKKAGCESIIKKNGKNIYMKIGENGSLLSGGEKQRIDLARAIARKSMILILDEPSSNLDNITEKIIKNAIKNERLKRNLTVIVIGHRLNWFSDYTKVLVIKAGEIEAIGSHTHALKHSKWYKEAWESSSK